MKKLPIAVALLTFMAAHSAAGQVGRNNEKPAATYTAQSSEESQQLKEDRVKLEIDQIPDLVRLTLETEKRYLGWHNAQIFLDRATGEYIFHITDSTNATRTFMFDEQGKDLSNQTPAVRPKKAARKG